MPGLVLVGLVSALSVADHAPAAIGVVVDVADHGTAAGPAAVGDDQHLDGPIRDVAATALVRAFGDRSTRTHQCFSHFSLDPPIGVGEVARVSA
jgi:hypothetical protein